MAPGRRVWDVVVVGAGPAGAAAALGALAERPGASVLMVDRAGFPRDKVCGDGVAPHVLDVLAGVGAPGLLDDWAPTPTLSLSLELPARRPGTGPPRRTRSHPASARASHDLARPGYVVPRRVLDARIVAAAQAAGAHLVRSRVRAVTVHPDRVELDDGTLARVLVGADGAHSAVRRGLGLVQRPGTTAIAVRGYAPVAPGRAGEQVIVFDPHGPRPAYAWSFDTGRGSANVGYGQLLGAGPRPSRARLLERLDALLPGAGQGVRDVAGHPLPLSTGRPTVSARGRVLLAGDAAGLVNPITGEGIYYAVLSGALAGRAAVAHGSGPDRRRGPAGLDGPAGAGRRYSRALRANLGAHLLHTRAASTVAGRDALLLAALRACARSPRAFEDLAELGLARGRLTPAVLAGLGSEVVRGALPGRAP